MNLQFFAMWITLIGATVTVLLLIGWTATGRRNATLRITAGLCGIVTMLSFLSSRFLI